MVSTIMLIVVITNLLELDAFNKGDDWLGNFVRMRSRDPNKFLHKKKVRRFKIVRYLQTFIGFTVVTGIGFFVNGVLVAKNPN
jgi:hypothetical protein